MSADHGTPPASGDGPAVTLEYLLRRMRHKSDFPTLSASVSRIQAMSDAENESLASLSDEILKDVALTQKLLRVVNTAHYRRSGDSISTVSRAVMLIGVAGIRNLALSLTLVEHMQDKHHAQQLKEEFLRTVMAGTLASELSSNAQQAEQAFIEALFRNLGRLLAEFYLPEDAHEVRLLVKGDGGAQPLSEAQASAKVLGMPFQTLGVAVGKTWNLPDTLVTSMVAPDGAVPKRSLAARPERLLWLSSLANEASDAMLQSEPVELGANLEALTRRYATALDLAPHAVQEAAARARKRLTELTQVLQLKLDADSPAERLLPDEDGALAVGTEAPPIDSIGILTSGIQDITNTMVDSFKLNEVLQMILETVYRALDCRRVIFCLRDAKTSRLLGRFGLGEGADKLIPVFQVPLKVPEGAPVDLFTAVCLKGVDTLIADASTPAIVSRLPTWFRDRVQAPTFLLLPMSMKHQKQDVVLGLIYADKGKADSMHLTEKELSLLRTLRSQAVMAFKQTVGG
ncbi:MAG: HDOD domain-containing protein [Rubrivivax sp.]|nr:MAG: HDOD domain-containing protein [Rubrivivax sp.]